MAQAEEDKSSSGPYCYAPHISSSSNLMASSNQNIQASSFSFDQRSKYSADDDVDQIYHLTTGVEMIGFHNHNKTSGAAAATTNDFYNQQHQGGLIMSGSRRSSHVNDVIMGGLDDDDECAGNRASLSRVFPCEGNERPSQGLSLSLNSNNPSSISLQSFELRRPAPANTPPSTTTISHQHQGSSTAAAGTHNDVMRFISSSSPNWPNTSRYHDHVGKPSSSSINFVGGSTATINGTFHHVDEFNDHHHQAGQHFLALSYSKYFPAAQELLNEFCSLGTKEGDDSGGHNNKKKLQQYNSWEDQQNDTASIINGPNSSSGGTGGGNCSSSSSREQQSALYALDLLELQKRKRRLLAMLEELERRYRHYSTQMKLVVSSFEAVAGDGSASVYTSSASKAMSRHFRCLKDGIVTQIKAFNKVIAEKDPTSSSAAAGSTSTTTAGGGGGITKGETPRLRILDQTLRQQRAYQQMSMMETHPWRPQRGLPERSVSLLRAWLFEHFLHPYPSDVDKHILARQTGLTRSQVSNWFINARVRLWKPMVEEMYLEETKEEQEKFMASSSSSHHDQLLNTNNDNNDGICNNNNNILNDHTNYGFQTTTQLLQQDIDDQKPNVDALIRFGRDSQCISSIITANNNINLATADKNVNKSIKIPAAHHHHANNTSSLHLNDQQQQQEEQGNFGRVVEAFGPIDIDFASYNENAHHHHHHHPNSFGGMAPSSSNTTARAGGVSLTLGLQQNEGNNIGGAAGPVNLAFSNAATAAMHVEHSLYYPTGDHDDRMVEPAVHEYSLFDADHGAQNLPYRNLMGAQMLHDFA